MEGMEFEEVEPKALARGLTKIQSADGGPIVPLAKWPGVQMQSNSGLALISVRYHFAEGNKLIARGGSKDVWYILS
jgi:hypothetical protein